MQWLYYDVSKGTKGEQRVSQIAVVGLLAVAEVRDSRFLWPEMAIRIRKGDDVVAGLLRRLSR